MNNGAFEAFEKVFGAWLKTVDSTADFFLKSPVIMTEAGKWVEWTNLARARGIEAREKALSEARFATKDDVDRIGASVHELEGKINEILLALKEREVREPQPVAEAGSRKARKAKGDLA